jgi:hypothetical protein
MARGSVALSLMLSFLVNVVVFAALAFGGGLGTALYMIDSGTRLSTKTYGPWLTWTAAGRPDADPYTRAHVARNGAFPLASTLELTYEARTDSSGGRLYASCEYIITLEGFDAAWWSLAVFDRYGRLIPNSAERHAYNSDTILREPDGRAVITLARDARPGNWLPTGGGGRIVLVLTVQDAAWAAAVTEGDSPRPMPAIQRGSCR